MDELRIFLNKTKLITPEGLVDECDTTEWEPHEVDWDGWEDDEDDEE